MARTISNIREIEKRLRATADQMIKMRELARPIGGYTVSRFERAWACLTEAADCMSYAMGYVESHMPIEEREAGMNAILSAMSTELLPENERSIYGAEPTSP